MLYVLVTGKSETKRLDLLREVFECLGKHGIRAKRVKCKFMKDSVEYLGYCIDAMVLHAMDEKIKAITDAPISKNLQELRSFLGLLNYYGKFNQ